MTRLPNYNDIHDGQINTQKQTCSIYEGWVPKFQKSLTVLIQIPYIDHTKPDIQNEDYHYYYIARETYCNAPMAFAAAHTLMEQGFYSEAYIVIRSLIEKLVKLRYFANHKEQVASYELTGKDTNNKKISIASMWEEVTGDKAAYNKIYSFTSKFTHGAIGANTPSMINKIQQDSMISLMPQYNKIIAEGIINYLVSTLYGYLNLAPSFIFYKWETQPIIHKEYDEIKAWLLEQIDKHETNFSQSSEWHKLLNQIIK